ncbi:hypothetical protein EMPS_10097 [Entomortierella parvispora]|uniref:F-box domain-containing protein n=1 Tax=Entomortierella parvispora TaxID=205924 RepID=A0A9P3M0X6_9FUNG|nr:hypothetical protein EMPS_10097 [Entomortierella parvispora]
MATTAAIDRIPAETLDHVFSYLNIHQIYRCLTVSKFWFEITIARLYSFSPDMVLTRQDLFDLFYKRRHHIRHAAWNCSPPFNDHFREIESLLTPDPSKLRQLRRGQDDEDDTLTPALTFSTVKTLMFEGKLIDDMMPRFYEFLSKVPSLTRLELQFTEVHVAPAFFNQPPPLGMAAEAALLTGFETAAQEVIDLWTLLDILPNLEHLNLMGCRYVPRAEPAMAVDNHAASSSTTITGPNAATEPSAATSNGALSPKIRNSTRQNMPRKVYRLKSFHFSQMLFASVDPVLLLSQLPDLDELGVHSSRYFRHVVAHTFYDPVIFARALRLHCPKITHLVVEDWLPICLVLPATASSTLPATALAQEVLSVGATTVIPTPPEPPALPVDVTAAQPISVISPDYLHDDLDLVDYNGEDSLEPILPLLTTLECPRGIFTAEDFEQCYRLQHLVEIDVSDSRDADRVLPFVINRWRDRPQTRIQSHHLQAVLERCSKLKDFRATHRAIRFEDMVLDQEEENDDAEHSRLVLGEGQQELKTRPWACEATLEYLSIGFILPSADKYAHRAVWSQLGRLQRIEDLSLVLTNLIPSLDHGMTSLSLLPRLKRYSVARTCWGFPEKEAALWIATECRSLEKWRQDCLRSREMVVQTKSWFEGIGKGKLWVNK